MSEETPKTAPSVYQHLAVMLDQMAAVSWQKLGLHPDMVTGRLEPNLGDAKVAIDVAAYLAQLIEPTLDDEDKRQVQHLVRDLRLNFVQKSKETSS